jgi:F420-non-reducing hydrogenase small subunit
MPHEPRIVAFLCSSCAYEAADRAGQAHLEYPQSLLTVRVTCTGRVEPAFVLQAFREGADGVLVAGCHPGDCHYVDGNVHAATRHEVLSRALAQAGIEPGRLRLTWASATEAERLAATVREMTAELRALGPLGARGRGDHSAGARRDCASAEPALAPAPRAAGRPRVAFYWNASCGGCDEAIVDLGDGFAALLEKVEIVLWPLALDAKRKDVEALPDGGIDVAFVNGAVRLTEHDEWARLLRRKARVLVAFGACAHTGGVVGLGNLSSAGELLRAAYRSAPSISNPEGPLPGGPSRAEGHALSLPVLLPAALPLRAAVPVDYTIPGCPPSPAVIGAALDRLLGDDLPPPGAVLAPDAALCETCPRRETLPERLEVTALRRLATSAVDPVACFLAQGLVCMGPATRQGCQPGCVEAGMPCRGCFGPLDAVADGGAAMLSAFASLLAGGEAERRALAAALPDPAGTFWRYTLAAGLRTFDPATPGSERPAGRTRGEQEGGA